MDEAQPEPGICSFSDAQWAQLVTDAATVIDAEDRVSEVLTELIERPFDPTARQRVRQLLEEDAWERIDQAARRVTHLPEDSTEETTS